MPARTPPSRPDSATQSQPRPPRETCLAAYRNCTRRDYALLTGVRNQQQLEQAQLHGIPIGATPIDLGAVLTWMHRFIADNSAEIRQLRVRRGRGMVPPATDAAAAADLDLDDDPVPRRGVVDEHEARYRKERADRLELENARRREELRDVEEVQQAFELVGASIRRAAEQLRKQFGADAADLLDEALQEAEEILGDRFGSAG